MEVDFFGKASVNAFLAQTGLQKFIIQKIGAAKNSTPIFAYLETGNNSKAVEEFSKFANACNNSQPYEMIAFNSLDDIDSEQDETKSSRRKKDKTVKFTFQLKKEESNTSDSNDIKSLLAGFMQEQQNNTLAAELKLIREKLEAIENEEEEEEEETNIIGGINLNQVDSILSRLAAYGIIKAPQAASQPQTAQFAGDKQTDDELAVKKANIEKAINILYKYDDKLDTDLLKLESIAENQKAIFDMVIQQLRNM